MQTYMGYFILADVIRLASENGADADAKVGLVAERLMTVYVRDVVAFVETEVKKELAATDVDDPEFGDLRRDWQVVRSLNLKTWVVEERPLAFGRNQNTILCLCKSVAPTEEDLLLADAAILPQASIRTMTLQTFATAMYNMGKPSPDRLGSPVVKGGIVVNILSRAIRTMRELLSNLPAEHVKTAVIRHIMIAAQNLHINFVPGTQAHQGAGAPQTWPRHNAWTEIKNLNEPNTRPLTSQQGGGAAPLQRAVEHAAQRNALTEWTILDVRIQDLHRYLQKDRPPADFNIHLIHTTSEVQERYDWAARLVVEKWQDPIVQLALILSRFVAQVCPFVWSGDNGAAKAAYEQHPGGLTPTDYIRRLPWTSKSRGGASQDNLYFIQLVVYIIIAVHPSSPLRHTGSAGAGRDWTKKHGA